MTIHETPQSPGSYAEFLATHPELDQTEASAVYYDSLDTYRDELAGFYGISREELHDMKFRRIGQQATASQLESV